MSHWTSSTPSDESSSQGPGKALELSWAAASLMLSSTSLCVTEKEHLSQRVGGRNRDKHLLRNQHVPETAESDLQVTSSFYPTLLSDSYCGSRLVSRLLETLRKIPTLRSDASVTTHVSSFPSHGKQIGFIHQTITVIFSSNIPPGYHTLRKVYLIGSTLQQWKSSPLQQWTSFADLLLKICYLNFKSWFLSFGISSNCTV